jgi:hypothetical protein
MTRRALALAALLMAALSGAATRAGAQLTRTAAINESLTILFPPLTATGMRPLQFGTLVPGTARTVLPTDAAGGELRVSGMKNKRSIVISFTLPADLRNASNQALPISFNGNFAANCEITTADVCDATTLHTWNPTTGSFTDTPDRSKPGRPRYTFTDFSVYIGGTVSPAATQPAGTYTGTVTVNLVVN